MKSLVFFLLGEIVLSFLCFSFVLVRKINWLTVYVYYVVRLLYYYTFVVASYFLMRWIKRISLGLSCHRSQNFFSFDTKTRSGTKNHTHTHTITFSLGWYYDISQAFSSILRVTLCFVEFPGSIEFCHLLNQLLSLCSFVIFFLFHFFLFCFSFVFIYVCVCDFWAETCLASFRSPREAERERGGVSVSWFDQDHVNSVPSCPFPSLSLSLHPLTSKLLSCRDDTINHVLLPFLSFTLSLSDDNNESILI